MRICVLSDLKFACPFKHRKRSLIPVYCTSSDISKDELHSFKEVQTFWVTHLLSGQDLEERGLCCASTGSDPTCVLRCKAATKSGLQTWRSENIILMSTDDRGKTVPMLQLLKSCFTVKIHCFFSTGITRFSKLRKTPHWPLISEAANGIILLLKLRHPIYGLYFAVTQRLQEIPTFLEQTRVLFGFRCESQRSGAFVLVALGLFL